MRCQLFAAGSQGSQFIQLLRQAMSQGTLWTQFVQHFFNPIKGRFVLFAVA
ncbi:hypothetical protein CA51_19910 [Rosistilla oblonga]|uniref:Uncharacterized protein n=1 Tax=Rosistilla oblonga TaxID=2527990 RepID=A0A518ISR1_9BACT|nr:hypothetical protein CA51_19910 [Rosistilla oblonga]QDV56110.1 hypothetical protein Mal33_20890 [Rosistilla oblonga]